MANLVLIRDLCEQKRITIRELAARVGRDESSIQSAMRRGSTNTATLEEIANVLEVSPGYFFDGAASSEVRDLRREVEHLKEIVKEKERTIEILMASQK